MFAPGPSAKERASAKAWGWDDDDIDGPPVQVWPANAESVGVLYAMRTQWRTGMGGSVGLDYSVLPFIWEQTQVPQERRAAVFADLQVMESAALTAMHPPREEGNV